MMIRAASKMRPQKQRQISILRRSTISQGNPVRQFSASPRSLCVTPFASNRSTHVFVRGVNPQKVSVRSYQFSSTRYNNNNNNHILASNSLKKTTLPSNKCVQSTCSARFFRTNSSALPKFVTKCLVNTTLLEPKMLEHHQPARALSISKPLSAPVYNPGIYDPREFGDTAWSGLNGAFAEISAEMMMDPKAHEMYAIKRRYRTTEGRKKFERRNGLKKRMWKREMNKRLEPIVKTFGFPEEEPTLDDLGPPPLVYYPPEEEPRFNWEEDPDDYE